MLPRHIFASPVVMFTKRKIKYMSCGGKAINMHAEMTWSLGVRVRGGGAGGERLGQVDTGASALGSGDESLVQDVETKPAVRPAAGLCPAFCWPRAKGPGGEDSVEGPHPSFPPCLQGGR